MITTYPTDFVGVERTTRSFKNALDKILSFYFGNDVKIGDDFLKFIIIVLLVSTIIISLMYGVFEMFKQYEPRKAEEDLKDVKN